MDLKQILLRECDEETFFKRCKKLDYNPDFDGSKLNERAFSVLSNPLVFTGKNRFEDLINHAFELEWLRVSIRSNNWHRYHRHDYVHFEEAEKQQFRSEITSRVKNNKNNRNYLDISFINIAETKSVNDKKLKIFFHDFEDTQNLIGVGIISGIYGLDLVTNQIRYPRLQNLAIWDGQEY